MSAPDQVDVAPIKLQHGVQSALRHIRAANDSLASRRRSRVQMAQSALENAQRELENALGAHFDAGTSRLRDALLTALGPDLKWGTVVDCGRVLELLIECLWPDREIEKRTAAAQVDPLIKLGHDLGYLRLREQDDDALEAAEADQVSNRISDMETEIAGMIPCTYAGAVVQLNLLKHSDAEKFDIKVIDNVIAGLRRIGAET